MTPAEYLETLSVEEMRETVTLILGLSPFRPDVYGSEMYALGYADALDDIRNLIGV